jgi:regulator of sirC expression with transglutaminase-like and TPR domain
MSAESRERLVRLVRRHDADLAEAALLCGVEADPHLDVDATLLRIDALADVLRSRGAPSGRPRIDAQLLSAFLAGELRFTGGTTNYYDPDNALLHRVLDTRRGLPITLAIVYVAIARRLGVQAYAVNLPGHVVAAIAGGDRPVVLDPFHDGVVLDDEAVAARVAAVTAGQVEFRRSMLRPAPAVDVVRRLLHNLTRDLSAATHPGRALWTVELKLLLPNRAAEDHRVLGELLAATGRFDAAADAFEHYLELVGEAAPDVESVRRAAIQSRARLN